jgi:hypothetical protein
MAIVGSGFLMAGGAQYLDLVLQGGITYEVYVRPSDDNADFDLQIMDENGNLVEQDTSTASDALCYITPAWNGPFRMIVSAAEGSGWYQISVEA